MSRYERVAVRVIMKRCPNNPKEPIAFLPDVCAQPGRITCYQHIGQHGEADIEFYRACRPANLRDADVRALTRELRSIGYEPIFRRRIQWTA